MPEHKAGFVNIIGKPNAGKSTLMNGLVGEQLSIITPKAQTTRHRILGIVNGDDYQVVFSDTPGFIQPKYKLQEQMMQFVQASLQDADVVLFVVDVLDKKVDDDLLEKLKVVKEPLMVLLNKVDQVRPEQVQPLVEKWRNLLPHAEKILPIAAIGGYNLKQVMLDIVQLLPEHPPFYPKDQLTDQPERFFVTEMIREKILTNYKQEIPYSVEVAIESFKEEEKLIRISALIFVNRQSQKPIIIGKGGEAIKKVGTEARKSIEDFLGKKVYLELHVKVRENWRDNMNQLRNFGYDV